MGAFFTNVQVRAGERALAPLEGALRESAVGMELLAPDDARPAERTIVILPADAGGWVTIYDEDTDMQDLARLDALASLASRALEAPAFAAMIHDSDILVLRAFEGGARVDQLDSAPGYFGQRVSAKKRAQAAGDPAKWGAMLAPGHAIEELRAAWTGGELSAEGMLSRTCEILGCEPSRALMSYRYLQHTVLPEGTVTLRFRPSEALAREREVSGPPRFTTHAMSGPDELALAVGDVLRLSLTALSVGGASKGISVLAWGDAIDRGLVTIERMELIVGSVLAGARPDELVVTSMRGGGGEALQVADAPDAMIPAGTRETHRADPMKAFEAMQRTSVHANVVGRVIAPGKGTLLIGLQPHAAREEGSDGAEVVLAIDPPFARPLRASADLESSQLRPLAGDRYLVALLAVDAPRAVVARMARAGLDAAREAIPDVAEVHTATFMSEPGKRPKTGRGKAKTLLRGKRLDALFDAMAVETTVTITAGPMGVTFGTGVLAHHEDLRVPMLALWIDATVIDSELLERIRASWCALIDDALREGTLVQGSLARTGAPMNASPDHTAYESACGISSSVVTLRSWVTRWVRVPGNDRTWLGAALLAHLDGEARARLGELGEIHELGAGLRITLADRAHAPDLERAIEALLPTGTASWEAMRALHAPRE